MSKRSREVAQDERPPKRPKQAHNNPKRPPVEEIQFARQLQQFLTFRQDGVQDLRQGIASFKALLDNVLYQTKPDDRARQLSILREYLDSEKPVDVTDTERPFLGQLWQAWSFANQNYIDTLASSISAIIALLLKTLSGLLDFREHGILLCRTVLQHQHLRLVKRGLEAPRNKESVISPCLRLLIEVASFDGGVLAKEVYKRRELTFDVATTRRNLGLVRNDIPQEELHRRSSIRTWTVRYILTLLKYVHEGGKIDLLTGRPICTGLFQNLRDDPPDLVVELLDTVETHVLKDTELPRSAKTALLIQQNLERVTEIATRSRLGHAAADKAYAWLKSACSNPAYGLLRASGWYPPGTTSRDHTGDSDDSIDLGLDSLDFYDHDIRPDVRNTTLLPWLLTLRPHTSLQERELLLLCFRSAPELVAAYFAEKNMQFEPKLSNTWIGYASFVFDVVQLPLPEFLGNGTEWADLPPQTDIMIESILPRPLTQKALTRCLTQNSDLVTFFAVRLLALAFEKLSRVRAEVEKAAKISDGRKDLWRAASDRLLTRFVDRCPKIRDVIAAFRKMPQDDDRSLQREATARLLRLYYEVTPLKAYEEPHDISSSLTAALVHAESGQDRSELSQLRALELEHLVQIARHSTGMRWLSKQGALEYSPILSLIKLHRQHLQNRTIRELIYDVLSENNIAGTQGACDAFIASLLDVDDETFVRFGPFLDDCFTRASRKPVKYLDDLEATAHLDSGVCTESTNLLIAVLLEQAPFVAAKPATERDDLVAWIAGYLDLTLRAETIGASRTIVEKIKNGLDLGTLASVQQPRNELLEKVGLSQATKGVASEIAHPNPVTATPFATPPAESEDHPELSKWLRKDLEIALEDGDVDALMLCLCSQYPEIRAQAQTQLYKLMDIVHSSNVEDRDAICVLLGELLETYEYHCAPKAEALPYLAGTFATNALHVQMQPAHFMYPKMNRYLNKGPEWRIQKLPNYWIDNTVHAMPSEDDTYWAEAQWTLDWLVDGLRTPTDLDILRRAGALERVMSFCSSPGAAGQEDIRKRVLELLWRATIVERGSNTLITRTGVLSWLDLGKAENDGAETVLRKRIIETCERDRIEEWGGMGLEYL